MPLVSSHRAGEEQRRPRGGRADDRLAVAHHRGALPPERPEQVRGRRLLLGAVVHQAHQRRQAEAARHQPHLVVARRGELAEPGDNADAGVELRLGQPHLPREVVQVADERLEDLTEPRVVRPGGLREDRLGQLDLVLDDHVRLPTQFSEPLAIGTVPATGRQEYAGRPKTATADLSPQPVPRAQLRLRASYLSGQRSSGSRPRVSGSSQNSPTAGTTGRKVSSPAIANG